MDAVRKVHKRVLFEDCKVAWDDGAVAVMLVAAALHYCSNDAAALPKVSHATPLTCHATSLTRSVLSKGRVTSRH